MVAQESARETKGVSVAHEREREREPEKNGTINAKICMSSAGKVTMVKRRDD